MIMASRADNELYQRMFQNEAEIAAAAAASKRGDQSEVSDDVPAAAPGPGDRILITHRGPPKDDPEEALVYGRPLELPRHLFPPLMERLQALRMFGIVRDESLEVLHAALHEGLEELFGGVGVSSFRHRPQDKACRATTRQTTGNFGEYLIAADGTPLGFYSSRTSPADPDLRTAILAALEG